MCAGPYSQRLLGIDAGTSSQLLAELQKKEDNELLRPGYVRVSLPYYVSADELAFVGDALAFVCEHGWKLLSQYCPDGATAEWRHVHQRRPPRQWLGAIDYSSGEMRVRTTPGAPPLPTSVSAASDSAKGMREARAAALAEARAHVQVAESQLRLNGGTAGATAIFSPDAEALRWFLLPSEAAAILRGAMPSARSPFWPPDAPQHVNWGTRGTGGGATGGGRGEGGCEAGRGVAGGEGEAEVPPAPSGVASLPPGISGAVWLEPPRKLSNKVLRAVLQHGMLRPGDRVLLGLSGGKDSLTLLHALHHLQSRTPFAWELAACTVDPMADGFDPSPLIPYLAALGVPYFYEREDIIGSAASVASARGGGRVSICAFCSRIKRGVLYRVARTHG
jgi:hypothetical protein